MESAPAEEQYRCPMTHPEFAYYLLGNLNSWQALCPFRQDRGEL